ncbi:LysR family transcriptional regulator [Azospirillum brasilense]|nr:LysR family transcriptional regulator [Azospirillum brasilense]
MELRQLRYLNILAEAGSFHRAAHWLGLRQPALSQSIRALEMDIGVQLVTRTSSGSRLTAAGSAFLSEAQRILAALDAAAVIARTTASRGSAPMRLGIAADAATGWMAKTLQAFLHGNPEYGVVVYGGSLQNLLAMLDNGHLDLCLLPFIDPIGNATTEPLWREDVHLALPATHPLAAEPSVDVRRLADELLLVGSVEYDSMAARLLLDACYSVGVKPRITTALPHQEVRLALVAAGFGIAVLPASNQSLVTAIGITSRPLTPPLVMTIAAVWPATGLVPSAQHFIKVARSFETGPRIDGGAGL